MNNTTALAKASLVMVACMAWAGAAQAVTTPFNWASVDLESVPSGVSSGYVYQLNTSPLTTATESFNQSGDWGSASAFASADLATGQLKVAAAAADAAAGSNPYVNVNAFFGDSFTTTAGNQPFAWTSSTTAQFTLALNGSLTSTSPLPDLGASAFVVLALYQKGTLDPTKPLLGSNLIAAPFLWTIGNAGIQLTYTDLQGNHQPVLTSGTFDVIPPTITASITPGGDFDWMLLLGTGGQPGPNQSFNIDLSHTLTLSYQGPAGTTTTSASGLFQNFVPVGSVPEPQTWLLGMAGLLIVGGVRRWRRA